MRILVLLLTLAVVARGEPETIEIKTLPGQMRYDTAEIAVTPGLEVKLRFENTDEMPHNLIFFRPETDVVEVCTKQLEQPEEALKRNWLPEDPRMWMHSKVLNPHETEELVFTAPTQLGRYPYVCSMPGHALTMNGVLIVAKAAPPLRDLQYKMYLGDWKKLPKFDELTPFRAGEMPRQLMELQLDDYRNQFGVVFTGKLTAPHVGQYDFYLASDDGARLLVDGKMVVEHDGIGPAKEIYEGKVKLENGPHELRVEYFQSKGEARLFVAWHSSTFPVTPLTTWLHPQWRVQKESKKEVTTGLPLAVGKEPVLYRNFIEGAGQRGIGVGYPGGFNLAWSAETFNLAVLWRGAFIDAARHWLGRGGGTQAPLGYDVVHPAGEATLPFAIAPAAESVWPSLPNGSRAADYHWKGYELDARRYPTFHYEWNGVQVSERYEESGDAMAPAGRLMRMLRLEGEIPAGAVLRVATGAVIQPEGEAYRVGGGVPFLVQAEGARISGDGLLVPARPEMRIFYSWPEMHQHAAAK